MGTCSPCVIEFVETRADRIFVPTVKSAAFLYQHATKSKLPAFFHFLPKIFNKSSFWPWDINLAPTNGGLPII